MFNVALFGLKILMGHVQRLMEKHLGPTKRVPFQDNVAVASATVEEHIKNIGDSHLQIGIEITFEEV